MTSRSAGGSFEKQCGTSFYHKDWNIENKNMVSRRFIVKTNLDQLDKIVKCLKSRCLNDSYKNISRTTSLHNKIAISLCIGKF